MKLTATQKRLIEMIKDESDYNLKRFLKMTDVPKHEHGEGMNECSICDESRFAYANRVLHAIRSISG